MDYLDRFVGIICFVVALILAVVSIASGLQTQHWTILSLGLISIAIVAFVENTSTITSEIIEKLGYYQECYFSRVLVWLLLFASLVFLIISAGLNSENKDVWKMFFLYFIICVLTAGAISTYIIALKNERYKNEL